MYLSLSKNNPQILFIKNCLLQHGDLQAKDILRLMPDDIKGETSEKTLIQYCSYVKTHILEKKVVYLERKG